MEGLLSLIFLIPYYLFIFIPSVIFVGIIAHIKNRDVFGWVLLSVFLIAPIVLLVLIFMPSLGKNQGWEQRVSLSENFFDGNRNLKDTNYKKYLFDKYLVKFNPIKEKFYLPNESTFNSIDEFYVYADSIEKVQIQAKIQSDEMENLNDWYLTFPTNQIKDIKAWFVTYKLPISIVFSTILTFTIFLFFLKSLADQDKNKDLTQADIEQLDGVDSNHFQKIEIPKSGNEKNKYYDEKIDETNSATNLAPKKTYGNSLQDDIKTAGHNEFLLNQIEFVNSLDRIGNRWDFIVSNFHDNHVILSEKLAPLFREINSLISQPSAKVSHWYCAINAVNKKNILCKYKSYDFSIEIESSSIENLRNLKNGAIVSFSGVLMSQKFQIFSFEDWSSSKPLIKIVNADLNE